MNPDTEILVNAIKDAGFKCTKVFTINLYPLYSMKSYMFEDRDGYIKEVIDFIKEKDNVVAVFVYSVYGMSCTPTPAKVRLSILTLEDVIQFAEVNGDNEVDYKLIMKGLNQ